MPSEKRPQQRPPRPWLRRLGLLLAAAVAVLAVIWSLAPADDPAPAGPMAHAAAPRGRSFFAPVGGSGAPVADDPARRREQLASNYHLADHTYCSYRQSSQYPFDSRPISENPDQVNPNAPVTETRPMHLDGGGANPQVQVQSSQSRVYMAANEAVTFSLRAAGSDGQLLPLVVTRALAAGITYGGTRGTPQVSVPFADDGNGGFAGVLSPGQTMLAGFAGTIRTEIRYSVNGKSGTLFMDVIYTPELPAVWAGQPREALENGSLAIYLKVDVRMPGRYIVNGRVDDAKGRPFALLTFNDVLAQGPNEVKLVVFGKLMRDQDVVAPLTLRDVDGFLLKENADPDRAMMPRLDGKVYTSKGYAARSFSDAEWQSEERTRYLTEYSKDATNARAALAAFDPSQPIPPSECAPQAPRQP